MNRVLMVNSFMANGSRLMAHGSQPGPPGPGARLGRRPGSGPGTPPVPRGRAGPLAMSHEPFTIPIRLINELIHYLIDESFVNWLIN